MSNRLRLRLIHWNAAEARERAGRLRALGYQVTGLVSYPALRRSLRTRPPAAVVIDLSRLPMQGRDMGIALRAAKGTRGVPLVFVDGQREKVARVRAALPDAAYCTWRGISSALRRAIARPPREPVAPSSNLAGYSGTPLPEKLGIKEGAVVALIGAPPEFEATLGALPPEVTLQSSLRGTPGLILWFTRTRRDLDGRIATMRDAVGRDGLWIIWPKQSGSIQSDLTQNLVRAIGLAHGLVDYKVCAVDATWSGLKFTRRKGR